jgi:hypothetical protein
VGDRSPVHLDGVVIIEIHELFPDELGAIVDDDGVGDPKIENNVLDKTYCLHGANFSHGPFLDPLSELVNCDKQVGPTPGCFLEGSQKVQTPHSKQHVTGMAWSSWVRAWICLVKY